MNKNVNLMLTIAFLAIAACADKNVDNEDSLNVSDKPKVEQRLGAELRYFNGKECVTGKGSCLPDAPIVEEAHHLAFSAFAAAVSDNETTDYFSGKDWKYLLPALTEHPKIVESLQSGVPVIKYSTIGNKHIYIATKLSREALEKELLAAKAQPLDSIVACFSFDVTETN